VLTHFIFRPIQVVVLLVRAVATSSRLILCGHTMLTAPSIVGHCPDADKWCIDASALERAAHRFQLQRATESAREEKSRLAAAQLEEQAIQAQQEQRQFRQLAEQRRVEAERVATEQARWADEAALVEQEQAEKEREAQEAAQFVEKLQVEQDQVEAEAAQHAEQLCVDQEQQTVEASYQADWLAEQAAAQFELETRTPAPPSPLEGVPEARASAWQGPQRAASFLALAAFVSPPTCIEGVPEAHMSAWRQKKCLSDSSASHDTLNPYGLTSSIAATPPNLATGLAAAANEAAHEARRLTLRWPEARRSSVVVHPSRTPMLDDVHLPAHPILLKSPDPPAAQTDACANVVSPQGSISLDGATGEGIGDVEESSPCWQAPTGHTPEGHKNAACSAGQFPSDSSDAGNTPGPTSTSPCQDHAVGKKRARVSLKHRCEHAACSYVLPGGQASVPLPGCATTLKWQCRNTAGSRLPQRRARVAGQV
jgi:hypothetical protein